MKETLRHQQAFEYYYMLGNERSFSKVASHFDISTVSVSKWAKELDWESRVIERDTKNMQAIREQNDLDMVKAMNSYRKVISASIADYIKRLKEGKVEINSVNDFTKLVRLDLELCGVLDTATKNDNDEAVSDETNNTLANIEQGLKELGGDTNG